MKKLDRAAFGRSRQFLMTRARPLERAWFAHRFERASPDGVLAELAHFQNQDGGFGRALEPDLRTPSSSALATGIGLRMLQELGCSAGHPMVRQAVAYLMVTCDGQAQVWPAVAPDTNSFPHAPWWHDDDGSLTRRFDGFRIIPRALIAGLLHHFSTHVSASWLDAITEETVRYIETAEVLGAGGGSDLEYAISLAATDHLPHRYVARLKARLREVIPAVVVRDPAKWNSYCITPLRIAPSPQSLGADLIHNELQQHLDFQITQQTLGGVWEPAWSWGGAYPEVWTQAKLEWCGYLTLKTLTGLDAFGRIEA